MLAYLIADKFMYFVLVVDVHNQVKDNILNADFLRPHHLED